MMPLVKFKDYLATKAGLTSIKASDLDGNFSAVSVVDDKYGIYKSEYSKDGTQIVFKAQNRSVRWIEIDICVDGAAKKMMVMGTDPY